MPGWNITKKDLTLLCRDGRALAVLLMLPMMFIMLIGMSVGSLFSADDDKTKVQFAIYEEVDDQFELNDFRRFDPAEFEYTEEEIDNAKEALPPVTVEELVDIGFIDEPEEADVELRRLEKNCRMLTERIIEKFEIDSGYKVTRLKTQQEVDEWQQANIDKVVMVFGKDFWTRVERLEFGDLGSLDRGRLKGGITSLDIYLDSRSKNSARDSLLQKTFMFDVMKTLGDYIFAETSSLYRKSEQGKEAVKIYGPEGKLPPLEAVKSVQKDPNKPQFNEAYIFIVPGFTVMFVFFLVNIMARSFLQEKHQGTLRRLQMAPHRPSSVLVGKTVPFLMISLLQTALLFLFGRLMFGMSWGSQPLLLLPVFFFTSLAATGLGLVVAMAVKTDSQVSSYSNLIVIMMAGVSGCIIPQSMMNSDVLRTMSLATPHYWSLNAFGEILKAEVPNMGVVIESCVVLIAFAAFFFVVGSILWRKKLAT